MGLLPPPTHDQEGRHAERRTQGNRSPIIPVVEGIGLVRIAVPVTSGNATENTVAEIVIVFGATGGTNGPKAADHPKPHERSCNLQFCNTLCPFRVGTMERRDPQRRSATFTTSPLGHRLHAAAIPYPRHDPDRNRYRKRDQNNQHE